jgi:hypothetical protein
MSAEQAPILSRGKLGCFSENHLMILGKTSIVAVRVPRILLSRGELALMFFETDKNRTI